MRIVKLLKYLVLFSVSLSILSYALLAEKNPFLSFLSGLVIFYGLLIFFEEQRISTKLSFVLSIFFSLFFFVDIIIISRNLFNAGTHLIILLIFHRLITLRNENDYYIILLLSFLVLISSGSITPNLIFLFLFFLFTFFSILFLLILSLYKGNFRIKNRIIKKLSIISAFSTITVFLLSPSLFFTIPRLGIGIGAMIGSNPPLTSGFTESVNLGDIGKIIENNKVVMRIIKEGSSPLPTDHLWRGKGFDHFDGKGWSSTLMVSKGIEKKVKYIGRWETLSINLEPLATDIIFLPYNLEWIRGVRIIRNDANWTFSSPFGSLSKRVYFVGFRVNEKRLIPVEEKDLKPYLQLPEFNKNIYELAKRIAGETKDPYIISKKIEEYLKKNFKYTLNLSSSSNPIEDFLLIKREGHCEYFSSAMAILLRHLGIPSRVVNGFKRGDFNPTGGYYVVREKDAHSWVEVYLDGKGWIPFDPTPSVPETSERNIFLIMRDTWDAIQFWWDRNFVTFSLGRQIGLYFEFYQLLRSIGLVFQKLKFLIVIPVCMLAIYLIFLLKNRKRKTEKIEEEKNHPQKRISPVKFYNSFLKIVRAKGFKIYEYETPFEFLERIIDRFFEIEELKFLTNAYYKVRFGGKQLGKDDIIIIEKALKKLKESK
ncbi:MAG: transglutaminase TgpA family protein [Candidatus Aminicenantia bacterium]